MLVDVTIYCDDSVNLSNTENFTILSMMLLQTSCWSFMEPDANPNILNIYIHIYPIFFPVRPPVMPFYSSLPVSDRDMSTFHSFVATYFPSQDLKDLHTTSIIWATLSTLIFI